MGRVFNAIELTPYQLRHAEDADRILRTARRYLTNPDDFQHQDAPEIVDFDHAESSTNPARPRRQQRMEAVEEKPQEPGPDDI